MAQLGASSTKQKATSSIPGQDTSLRWGLSPWLGHMWEASNQCFSLTWMFLSLSFSLTSPLSKIKKNKIFKYIYIYKKMRLTATIEQKYI